MIKTIDGHILAQMVISGANHLYNNRQLVNDLNVFPVPDGDTGTNMSMTMNAMAKALREQQSSSVAKITDIMSHATLRGARGNSGVILSQFFRGISKSCKGMAACTPLDFANALNAGADTAYRAVMNPTEGTILTVSREAATSAVVEANKDSDFVQVLESAVIRGNRALEKTREMLPALKQANVVDAGGQGWMFVLEGMLSYLKTNSIVELSETVQDTTLISRTAAMGNIQYLYCTEFLVQKKEQRVNVNTFRDAIAERGDCMLVIDDDDIVKVHIHTNHPGFVLERAVKLGELINIKIDNMKYQHQNLTDQTEENVKQEIKENKPYGFVAVCSGNGLKEICSNLGINRVIDGGQTMNPSTDDILQAVNEIDAKTVFVFPNNKNIILAANQAKEISDRDIIVIPTAYVTECFTAMLCFSNENTSQENEKKMSEALQTVQTGLVTYAVRDSSIDGIQIHEGDFLGMNGKNIVVSEKSAEKACLALMDTMLDDDSEYVTLYYGSDISEEEANKMSSLLEEKHEQIEVSPKNGGQPLYYYIISVE